MAQKLFVLHLRSTISLSEEDLAAVKAVARYQDISSKDRQSFLKDIEKYSDADIFLSDFHAIKVYQKLDDEVLDKFKNLKCICSMPAGYNHIDVEAVKKREITCSRGVHAVQSATADMAVYLILGATRDLFFGELTLRKNHFRDGCKPGMSLKNKTVGILGCGGIGKALIKRLSGFEVNMIYHNRRKDDSITTAVYCSFDELLATSDILVVILPLNKNTYHIIDKPEFEKMKRGIVFVNVGRGALVNEEELVWALDRGIVKNAGLDVFEHEPNVHPELIANEHTILVPHLGSYLKETAHEMQHEMFDNAINFIKTGKVCSPLSELME